jgi:hypothetical protein
VEIEDFLLGNPISSFFLGNPVSLRYIDENLRNFTSLEALAKSKSDVLEPISKMRSILKLALFS